jgi:hypothetical protein
MLTEDGVMAGGSDDEHLQRMLGSSRQALPSRMFGDGYMVAQLMMQRFSWTKHYWPGKKASMLSMLSPVKNSRSVLSWGRMI